MMNEKEFFKNFPPRGRSVVTVFLMGAVLIYGSVAFAVDAAPWEPQAKGEKWVSQHMKITARARAQQPKVLFIGDSITSGWLGRGKATWQTNYQPRGASCLGISGDKTQNVLWRIDHGALDGISPKVTILLIGTNNGHSSPPEDIVRGISAVVDRIRNHLPKTHILLLAVFPRAVDPQKPQRQKNVAVNQLLSQIPWGRGITYLDISQAFLEPNGEISPDIMGDYLHPTALGYERWAQAMDPKLNALLAEND